MFSPDNIFTTTIDKAVRWSRTQSMWPVTFGLACCAIEMMAAGSAKYDLARYGMEVFNLTEHLMRVHGRQYKGNSKLLKRYTDMTKTKIEAGGMNSLGKKKSSLNLTNQISSIEFHKADLENRL